jgi:general secretion pathway protein E
MTHRKKSLATPEVARMLLDHRVITPEQHRYILAHGEAQAERLRSYQQGGYSRRTQQVSDVVSPAEIISSFNLETAGSGKILTEDAITKVIAAAVGIPYVRIDPLKLNLDVVTSHVPRPFALKHLIVPLEENNGIVTVAVADPGNGDEIENLATARRIRIRRVLASKTDIVKILREFFGFRASVLAAQAESKDSVDLGNLEQ